ncbi:hypothetical protein BZA05DRAFT_416268 [Tricharina praecox]|uniref:uncharacterized protein n=1 Tax=Tricharina praecox TaxID=43433 RepID=UPI00221EF28F|nr:uncharacterized protein BZA05DRAFT_416268 [Tricharina praecox]KAI5856615.1 hypothetical protein BZA05DRAFT_416268 [Tricharina praecox]
MTAHRLSVVSATGTIVTNPSATTIHSAPDITSIKSAPVPIATSISAPSSPALRRAVGIASSTAAGIASYRKLRTLFIKHQRDATIDYVDSLNKYLKWADALIESRNVPPGELYTELIEFRAALFNFIHNDSDHFFDYDVAMCVWVPQAIKFKPYARKFDKWKEAIVLDFAENGVSSNPPVRSLWERGY